MVSHDSQAEALDALFTRTGRSALKVIAIDAGRMRFSAFVRTPLVYDLQEDLSHDRQSAGRRFKLRRDRNL